MYYAGASLYRSETKPNAIRQTVARLREPLFSVGAYAKVLENLFGRSPDEKVKQKNGPHPCKPLIYLVARACNRTRLRVRPNRPPLGPTD